MTIVEIAIAFMLAVGLFVGGWLFTLVAGGIGSDVGVTVSLVGFYALLVLVSIVVVEIYKMIGRR